MPHDTTDPAPEQGPAPDRLAEMAEKLRRIDPEAHDHVQEWIWATLSGDEGTVAIEEAWMTQRAAGDAA